MKYLFALLILCLSLTTAFSQENNLPKSNKQDILSNPTLLSQVLVSSTTGNYSRYTYYNDPQKKLLRTLTEIWQNEQWQYLYQTTYTYNATNKPTNVVYEQYNGTDWENVQSAQSTYDAKGNLLIYLVQAFQNGQWENQVQYTYTYNDESKNLSYKYEKWIDGNWSLIQYTQSAFNNSGDLESYVFEIWDGGQLQRKDRFIYTYDAKHYKVSELFEKFEDNDWVQSYRATYTNDEKGNNIEFISEVLDGGVWGLSQRNISQYDSEDNKLSELDQWYDGTDWADYERYNWTYSATDKELSFLREKYQDSVWVNSARRVSYEDEFGNINRIESSVWAKEQWKEDDQLLIVKDSRGLIFSYTGYRIEATYEAEGGAVNDNSLNIFQLSCFPNPANDALNFNYIIPESGYSSVSISNSIGIETDKIIDNQVNLAGSYNNNYNISRLIPGTYFITVKSGNRTETKKFEIVR